MQIGQQLASARRKKGINVKEAEEATKIRARFLDALEKNEFDILPGTPYVKGFIKSYASYLKIDPLPLIEEYKKNQPTQKLYEETQIPIHSFQFSSPLKSISKLRIPAALFTLMFIMALFLAYLGYQDTLLSSKMNSKEKMAKELDRLDKKDDSKKKRKQNKKKLVNTSLFKLSIESERGTWVAIRADEKTFFRSYLRQGEKRTFISRKPLKITAGRGSYVKVFIDGKERGTLSESPVVATNEYKK